MLDFHDAKSGSDASPISGRQHIIAFVDYEAEIAGLLHG